jgi:hypothetical protein
MNGFEKFWYRATGWFPRRLPQTEAELTKFKKVMVEAFGVEDTEASFLTIFGHLAKFEPCFWNLYGSHKAYRSLAITGKHLVVTRLIQLERGRLSMSLQNKLKEEFEKEIEKEKEKAELSSGDCANETQDAPTTV